MSPATFGEALEADGEQAAAIGQTRNANAIDVFAQHILIPKAERNSTPRWFAPQIEPGIRAHISVVDVSEIQQGQDDLTQTVAGRLTVCQTGDGKDQNGDAVPANVSLAPAGALVRQARGTGAAFPNSRRMDSCIVDSAAAHRSLSGPCAWDDTPADHAALRPRRLSGTHLLPVEASEEFQMSL